MERVEDLKENKYSLYSFAPTTESVRSYGALAGKGSWEGHVSTARQLKSGLNKNIREFKINRCEKFYKIPTTITKAAGTPVPEKPTRS